MVEDLTVKFWEDGYLVVENFFAEECMDELHRLILDHFGAVHGSMLNEEFWDKSKCEIVPWFPQREGVDAFDRIENDPELKNITELVLGAGWYSQYSMVMFSAKGTKGQAWHQDCPPEARNDFNLNRLIYTRDIVPEIGGELRLVPGTHRGQVLPAGDPDVDFKDQITLYPKKGTLVLLHGHCWHRVLPVDGPYRVSTNYRAAPKGTPEDVTDVCVYRNMRYRFSTKSVIEDRAASAVEAD